MYPELPKTSRERNYQIVSRQPARNVEITFYDPNFNRITRNYTLKHTFVVKDISSQNIYEFQTKSNGLQPGDTVKIYFENGDYRIKKVS